MGKGDRKTRRGKLFRGSRGVRRPSKKKKDALPVQESPGKATKKK
ncbi:MAG: 30S ribosomal protein THX [Bacteroidales bacterium]